jgi:hypothetical protein
MAGAYPTCRCKTECQYTACRTPSVLVASWSLSTRRCWPDGYHWSCRNLPVARCPSGTSLRAAGISAPQSRWGTPPRRRAANERCAARLAPVPVGRRHASRELPAVEGHHRSAAANAALPSWPAASLRHHLARDGGGGHAGLRPYAIGDPPQLPRARLQRQGTRRAKQDDTRALARRRGAAGARRQHAEIATPGTAAIGSKLVDHQPTARKAGYIPILHFSTQDGEFSKMKGHHRRPGKWRPGIFDRQKPVQRRWMMRLTAHGDQRFDPRLLASLDIRRADSWRSSVFGQKPKGSDMAAAGIVEIQDGFVGGEGEAVGREKIVGQQPPCQDCEALAGRSNPSAFSGKVVTGFPEQRRT